MSLKSCQVTRNNRRIFFNLISHTLSSSFGQSKKELPKSAEHVYLWNKNSKTFLRILQLLFKNIPNKSRLILNFCNRTSTFDVFDSPEKSE